MANNVSIEDVPLNNFHQLLCIRSGGGWLLDGYVLSIIGVAMVPLAAALGRSLSNRALRALASRTSQGQATPWATR